MERSRNDLSPVLVDLGGDEVAASAPQQLPAEECGLDLSVLLDPAPAPEELLLDPAELAELLNSACAPAPQDLSIEDLRLGPEEFLDSVPEATPQDLALEVTGRGMLRDVIPLMERPFFSLSKTRSRPISYESPDGRIWISVEAEAGQSLATIWDADLLIYATSLLAANRRAQPDAVVRGRAHDLLRTIGRNVGGRQYGQLRAALDRLCQTRVHTNLGPLGKATAETHTFSFIERWEITAGGELAIRLPEWLHEAIASNRILAISPNYFALSGGFERFLYKVARKHAGRQESGWTVTMHTLFAKSGSVGTLARFNFEIARLVQSNSLPDYDLSWVEGRSPRRSIRFIKRKH
jgi:plasmid replication initiation protein